jgi:DNA polymerase-3 subunit epsilon
MRTVFLDLETTGLDPRTDEILEIGILDDAGRVLLDSLVRPERHRR